MDEENGHWHDGKDIDCALIGNTVLTARDRFAVEADLPKQRATTLIAGALRRRCRCL
jgi:hypothetical protein